MTQTQTAPPITIAPGKDNRWYVAAQLSSGTAHDAFATEQQARDFARDFYGVELPPAEPDATTAPAKISGVEFLRELNLHDTRESYCGCRTFTRDGFCGHQLALVKYADRIELVESVVRVGNHETTVERWAFRAQPAAPATQPAPAAQVAPAAQPAAKAIPATTDEACARYGATDKFCPCPDAAGRSGGSYVLSDGRKGCTHRAHRLAQALAAAARPSYPAALIDAVAAKHVAIEASLDSLAAPALATLAQTAFDLKAKAVIAQAKADSLGATQAGENAAYDAIDAALAADQAERAYLQVAAAQTPAAAPEQSEPFTDQATIEWLAHDLFATGKWGSQQKALAHAGFCARQAYRTNRSLVAYLTSTGQAECLPACWTDLTGPMAQARAKRDAIKVAMNDGEDLDPWDLETMQPSDDVDDYLPASSPEGRRAAVAALEAEGPATDVFELPPLPAMASPLAELPALPETFLDDGAADADDGLDLSFEDDGLSDFFGWPHALPVAA